MSRRSGFLEGLIIGSAIGIGLGLLFAPQTGTELRKKIKGWKEDHGDLIEGAKEKTEVMIEKTKDAIEQGFDKLKRIVEENKQFSKTSQTDLYSKL